MRIAVVTLAVALVLALLYPERVITLRKQWGVPVVVDTAIRSATQTTRGAGKKVDSLRDQKTVLEKTQRTTPGEVIRPSETNPAVVPGNFDDDRPRATVPAGPAIDFSPLNERASAGDPRMIVERARDIGAAGTMPYVLAAVAVVAQRYGALKDGEENTVGSLNWLKKALSAAQGSELADSLSISNDAGDDERAYASIVARQHIFRVVGVPTSGSQSYALGGRVSEVYWSLLPANLRRK